MNPATVAVSLVVLCLSASTVLAQINPLFFGEDFLEGGGSSIFLYSSLQNQIRQLELNVRTGAVGGCEGGTVGPFNPFTKVLPVQFRRPFLSAPTLSLAASSIQVGVPTLPLNFQIRPQAVSPVGAQIAFADATNSIATAYVSYMACPSNSAIPTGGNAGILG